MILGEAPGDQERFAGRPFVGPAGRLLRTSLEKVGLAAEEIWLSNVVKYFKFASRGKRRLHKSPNEGEIKHCRWWLDLERRLLSPRLNVSLGTSAASSLTGNRAPLSPRRGNVETALDCGPVLITGHPSIILRLSWPAKLEALAQFKGDLKLQQAYCALKICVCMRGPNPGFRWLRVAGKRSLMSELLVYLAWLGQAPSI